MSDPLCKPRAFRIPDALNRSWYERPVAIDVYDFNCDGQVDLILRADNNQGVFEGDLKSGAYKFIQGLSQSNLAFFKSLQPARQRYLEELIQGSLKGIPTSTGTDLLVAGALIATVFAGRATLPLIFGITSACSDIRPSRSGEPAPQEPIKESSWTKIHNGPANEEDGGSGIALDNKGHVIVVGWQNEGDPPSDNIWVRKLNGDGETMWTYTNDTPGRRPNGFAQDVATDSNGNIYVAGIEQKQAWIQKFAPDGNILWTYKHQNQYYTEALGIAVDPTGNNIVVIGNRNRELGKNAWLQKLDRSGNEIWTKPFVESNSGNDRGASVVIDPFGYIYAVGYEAVTSVPLNTWIYKLDPNRNVVWSQRRENEDRNSEENLGIGITIDASNNVYVTGIERSMLDGQYLWLEKRDASTGGVIWSREQKGHIGEESPTGVTLSERFIGRRITTDIEGNVYVIGSREWKKVIRSSGSSHTDVPFADIWMGKYDPQGREFWTDSFGGPSNLRDSGGDIVIDEAGNIFMTGSMTFEGEYTNIWIRKIPAR